MQLAPQPADHGLADRDDVVLVDERHLDVELGELRLPVGPEVLVAEAAHDLVVALHAGDHQQLLEQLRRLRQRVPVAGLQPHRHQEVARALGRRAGEVGRLDLEEAAARP